MAAVRRECQPLGHSGGARLADLVRVLDQQVDIDVRPGLPHQPRDEREEVEVAGLLASETEPTTARADR
eukprot:4252613-Alexandrium_andersonii.AAC.1